ncbi:toll/interleukin-1 receptor domain-containing protein [Actinokineospora enzanensis]|uniref:toll/interleukin-1 receptor domain-containing protein n=1 Tax=Actinokineospora enzanensis TaxID=155975 RepID=UPI0003773E8B|nr:toll/interleukin-1 receptor domain-containing protein [Actinokineospora enzanensis]
MHVFISYARRDQASISTLRADFERFGNRVWFDRESHGGQDWWADVLSHVRGCVVFTFAVSPDSLRSRACLSELGYARALRRPILPVLVRPVDREAMPDGLPAPVDYVNRTELSVITLRKALSALPAARPLPIRLPEEPEIPTSYLNAYLARIDAPELDEAAQIELVRQLRDRMRNADERADVWDLLVRLRDRPELTRRVADVVERVLAPGWQPDPRELFDARYWDGQSWTTLVRQQGREFNDRNLPPRVHAHTLSSTGPLLPVIEPPARTAETAPTPAAKRRPEPRLKHRLRTRAPRRRKVIALAAGAAVLLGGGAVGAVALLNQGPGEDSAIRMARNFVDAVNTRDSNAMQQYVCAKDRTENAHLYTAFLDAANVTLESVDVSGSDPRFNVLATRTVGATSVRLRIPLVVENDEWRVCDISRALSGR